jgi:type I restriction enzyme S subunit
MCDIVIDLPSVSIQRKYADVYNSLLLNQKTYEKGLDDLKLTCDAYIENLRQENASVAIGDYITESDKRNTKLKYNVDEVKGISIEKRFIETKANMENVKLNIYKIINPQYFSYVSVTSRNGGKISVAYNDSDETFILSSSYIVFFVNRKDILLPDYLFMCLNRHEFNRFARFHSWGSAREVFSWDDMCNVKIPIPKIAVQQAIVDIFNAYNRRKVIVEKLKGQMKNVCPILVNGAVEESENKTRMKRR